MQGVSILIPVSHRNRLIREVGEQTQMMISAIQKCLRQPRDRMEDERLRRAYSALGELWEYWDVEGML